MTPFDLAAALLGEPVVQRNGMAAEVVGVLDNEVVVDLLVLSENGTGSEISEVEIRTTTDAQGRYKPEQGQTPCDLFMAA